jgi:hypothetical protein
MTAVELWRELPGGEIEYTMKRLRSADQDQDAMWKPALLGSRAPTGSRVECSSALPDQALGQYRFGSGDEIFPHIRALLFALMLVRLVLNLVWLRQAFLGQRIIGSVSLIPVVCAVLAHVRTFQTLQVSCDPLTLASMIVSILGMFPHRIPATC